MQSNYWCSQCPWQDSCAGPEGYYGYFQPMEEEDNYRYDEDPEQLEDEFEDDFDDNVDDDFEDELEQEMQSFDRAPRDVDRVVNMIERSAAREINEIVRTGLDRRLLNFMIREQVEYLDRNLSRYTGPMQRRVQEATRDIRREFNWVFDIMNLYRVPFATQSRLLDIIVRESLQNLRQPLPPPPRPRPPVPPRPPRPREEEE